MKSLVVGAHLRREDVEPLAVAVPVADLFLSAIEVAEDQPVSDRDLLLRVADVRARLLGRATFVAIRYGFTAASSTEAAAKCASHLERWRRLLEANRENVEVTLKVAAKGALPRPKRQDFASGADYLRALHAATHAAAADDDFRTAAEKLLAPLAVRHRWLPRDEKSVELVALVRRDALDTVRNAAEELRRQCPHVPFLFSGPWPLEVFADDDQQ